MENARIKKGIRIYATWLGSIIFLFAIAYAAISTHRSILLLKLDTAIGPATQDFIERALTLAQKQPTEAIIIEINTPGGLDKSMRGIIASILASPVPIISYVAPSGARAASAGTYIMYASHVAAMAPGTNLGAATPVNIGMTDNENKNKTKEPDALEKKAKNDAMAYIRSLAQLRRRNVQWAEQAVNQGVSLSATEALQMHVIDFIATDVPDLVKKVNQRTVNMQGQTKTLQTAGLPITEFKPDWRTRFLGVITDPNIAYILLIIGMWGLFFEFVNPGFILPGVVGAICLLLALYAFQLLPVNYAGLGLILLGVSCMIAEAFIASFGVLGIGGIVAFVIGSVMLLPVNVPGYHLALPLIIFVSVVTAVFFLIILAFALKARKRPVVSGREQLIGGVGTVMIDEHGTARIRIEGELWEIRAKSPLHTGDRVKVTALDNLVLIVKPISEAEFEKKE